MSVVLRKRFSELKQSQKSSVNKLITNKISELNNFLNERDLEITTIIIKNRNKRKKINFRKIIEIIDKDNSNETNLKILKEKNKINKADKNYHQFRKGCSLQSYFPSLYLIRASRSELDSMFLYNKNNKGYYPTLNKNLKK